MFSKILNTYEDVNELDVFNDNFLEWTGKLFVSFTYYLNL